MKVTPYNDEKPDGFVYKDMHDMIGDEYIVTGTQTRKRADGTEYEVQFVKANPDIVEYDDHIQRWGEMLDRYHSRQERIQRWQRTMRREAEKRFDKMRKEIFGKCNRKTRAAASMKKAGLEMPSIAQAFGVSERTIYRWLKREKIAAFWKRKGSYLSNSDLHENWLLLQQRYSRAMRGEIS